MVFGFTGAVHFTVTATVVDEHFVPPTTANLIARTAAGAGGMLELTLYTWADCFELCGVIILRLNLILS